MDRSADSSAAGRSPEQNPYAAPNPVPDAPPLPPIRTAGNEPSAEVFEELQRVANYRHMHKMLKASGTGSMIFGAIAIVRGLEGMQHNPINVILLGIGILLVVEGLWLVLAPVPIGIIVDGMALMLVGLWNVAIAILNAAAGAPNRGWPVIGIVQIVWGFQSFSRYSRFSKMPQEKPTRETLQRIDQIANDINQSKMDKDPELIQFQHKGFFGTQYWKGRLRGNHAVFVAGGGKDVIFARPMDVDFSRDGKVFIGKTLKGTFRISDRTFKGMISPDAFQRYEAWKGAFAAL